MAEGDAEVVARIDTMLDQLMVKHLEMASLCGEYRDLLERILDAPWDKEARKMASAMPGAKYTVATTFTREHAQLIGNELQMHFGGEDDHDPLDSFLTDDG
ncbi:MAG: hypothetical protein ACR2N6_00170 [Miltoncostaeaceae bacterium]